MIIENKKNYYLDNYRFETTKTFSLSMINGHHRLFFKSFHFFSLIESSFFLILSTMHVKHIVWISSGGGGGQKFFFYYRIVSVNEAKTHIYVHENRDWFFILLLYVFRLNIIIELNELFKEIIFISFIIIIIMIDCFTNIMIDFVIIKIAPLFMDLKWNFFFNFLNKFQNFFLWFRKSIFFVSSFFNAYILAMNTKRTTTTIKSRWKQVFILFFVNGNLNKNKNKICETKTLCKHSNFKCEILNNSMKLM